VISLNSKGLNKEEIAQELHVDQSTVSGDLQYIKHEAKIKIEKYELMQSYNSRLQTLTSGPESYISSFWTEASLPFNSWRCSLHKRVIPFPTGG
jgi:predicted transcriptional regulator